MLENPLRVIGRFPRPVRLLILGTLVNLPEFQQAFGCRPGAKMVRPPERRCTVW